MTIFGGEKSVCRPRNRATRAHSRLTKYLDRSWSGSLAPRLKAIRKIFQLQ